MQLRHILGSIIYERRSFLKPVARNERSHMTSVAPSKNIRHGLSSAQKLPGLPSTHRVVAIPKLAHERFELVFLKPACQSRQIERC